MNAGLKSPNKMSSYLVWVLEMLKGSWNGEPDFGILILNQPVLCRPQFVQWFWNKALLRGLVDGGSNRWLEFIEKHKDLDFALPDFISGDFDSIKEQTQNYFKSKGVLLIPTPDQDKTDFTKALELFVNNIKTRQLNVTWILAVCENCGRFDQTMANFNTLLRLNHIVEDINVVLISRQNIAWVLPPGKHTILVPEEFVEEQYSCGLIPLCGKTEITTSGLKWNLENAASEMGALVSTSNTYAAREISIRCSKNLVWTTEYSKDNE